jgi:hypothetical protein
MQRNTFLITCFMCVIQVLSAQSNFVDATIIQRDGKEVVGQIDYQEWKRNPRKVIFRTQKAVIKAFSPDSIKGFVIKENAERYLSATVTFNVETLKSGALNEFNSLKEALNKKELETESVFLLTLKTGILNFYSFNDRSGREHLFIQKDKLPFQELIYRKVIVHNQNVKEIREIKDYIFQLKKVAFNCPSVFDVLENVPFKVEDLTTIIDAYNSCQKNNTYTKNKDIRQTAVYAFAGIDKPFTTYATKGLPTRPATKERMNEKISPVLGLAYDFGFVRNRNKWGVSIELLYKPIKSGLTTQYQNPLFSSFKDTHVFNFDMQYVQWNTLIRHTFYMGSVQTYFKIGPSIAFIAKKNNAVTVTDGYSKQVKILEIETVNRQYGLVNSIGIKKGNLFLESRFCFEAGISDIPTNSVQSNYLDFIIGYSFSFIK